MSDLLFFPPRNTNAPETVLALHSSASSGRQWDAYAALIPGGMKLAAPDLMGYGASSDWKSGTPVTLKADAVSQPVCDPRPSGTPRATTSNVPPMVSPSFCAFSISRTISCPNSGRTHRTTSSSRMASS